MQGWIKSHRKMLDNPIVCKDSDYFSVWMYLLLNATHKECQMIFAGEKITLQKGQLITGRKSISEQFNISESKVQRILKTFESEQQIEQLKSNRNRLITIISWNDYQDDEQQIEQPVNNWRTTTEQPVNTNKNVKNVKNVKNDKNIKNTNTENRIDVLSLLNKNKVQMKGIYDLSKVDSYIGVVDDQLLEHCIELSSGKSVQYVLTVIQKNIEQGITTFTALQEQSKEPEPTGRLDFILNI